MIQILLKACSHITLKLSQFPAASHTQFPASCLEEVANEGKSRSLVGKEPRTELCLQ